MARISFLVSKYGAVIFFPLVAATTIYADWSHTREWKRQLQAKELLQKSELQ